MTNEEWCAAHGLDGRPAEQLQTEPDNDRPMFVIAYSFVALSSFIVGFALSTGIHLAGGW